MASNAAVFNTPEIKKSGTKVMSKPDIRLWTDDYSNLFRLFH
jgi:hypothetical protein